MEDMYYFAYGSNLNLEQMTRRCPDARRVGPCTLPNFKLLFRGVADIVPSPGDKVPGAIYLISERDLDALDIYEGYNRRKPQEGMYRKESFVAKIRGGVVDVMYYRMNRGEIFEPSESYYRCIQQGYRDWKLDPAPLKAARAFSKASIEVLRTG